MKVKATISPKVQIGASMHCPCVYNVNGVWHVLTEYGTYETFLGDLKNSPHKHRTNLKFIEKNMREISYEYENDPKLQSAEDKKTQKVVEIFWAQHPLLEYNGKYHKYTKNPMFNLENQNEKVALKVLGFKEKLEIQNRIAGAELSLLRDICDYYGVSAKGKTEDELIPLLGDPATGVCTNGVNAESFVKTWLEVTPETTMIVNLKKAIRLGVIEERKEGNRTDYYLGTAFLGTNFMDVLAYAKREEKIYNNHILREVNAKDDFSAEKVQSNTVKEIAKKVEDGSELVKSWTPAEIKEMRDELKLLKEQGYVIKAFPHHLATPPKLEAKLIEGRKAKEEKEAAVMA